MSEIQKCPNLVRGGGGVNIFQKCLKLKNVTKVGGPQPPLRPVNPNWDSVTYFLDFLF